MTMKVNTRTRLFFAVSLNLVLVRCLTSEPCLCFPGYSVIMMQPGGVHCCKGSVHNCKGSVDNGKGSIHNRKVSIHNRKVSVHNCKGSENGAVSLGQFAVQEHNKKENTLLEFVRVLTAKEQVVAGKLYHLTLEVIDAGKNKIYEAKVWVKPWRNFKQLQEFKPAPDVQSFSPLDLGAKHGNS